MKKLKQYSIFALLVIIAFILLPINPIVVSLFAETPPENHKNSPLVKLKGVPSLETTANDRKEIFLSIYNNNFALVKEVREIILPAGISELRFWDVSRQINPASVRVKSLNSMRGMELLEQNYEYDLITPQNLLNKYVGHMVKLLDEDDFSGSRGELQAELLSNEQGPIFRIGDEIHVGHPGRVVLPKLPEDLFAKPSLLWKLSVINGGKQTFEVSYLTEELDWEVDYAILLNTENTRGDLSGWATIKNNSGITFSQAGIQLVAGKVSRIKEPRLIRMKEAEDYGALSKGISEEGIFEYHLYNLPEKVTLKDRQTKQVHLFSAERLPIKKELRYYGGQHYYRQRYREEGKLEGVGIYLEFENRKTFHLGIPLPEGTVRVYESDSKGLIQFLGEDKISHTPEDEKVRVQTGYASNLIVERRQTDWRKSSSDILEVAWEIIFRNHKNEAAWIVVMESVPGDWEVMKSSHHWKKKEAHTLQFELSVAPKAEEMIRCRIRTQL